MMIDKSRINTHSYENNEPQRRRERKEKKNLCQWFGYAHHKPVSSVDKFSFLLVRRRPMGNSWVMIGLLLFLLALGGLTHYCCRVDHVSGAVDFLPKVPTYAGMTGEDRA